MSLRMCHLLEGLLAVPLPVMFPASYFSLARTPDIRHYS